MPLIKKSSLSLSQSTKKSKKKGALTTEQKDGNAL
jgi:hypothetical protein